MKCNHTTKCKVKEPHAQKGTLLCSYDGTDNLDFQAEKNTPAVTGAGNKE